MEKILLINVNDTDIKKVSDVFVRLRIRTDIVKPEFYGCTLGELASGNASAKPAGALFGESIVVMCGLRDKRLDKALFELRHSGVNVDYKAVLTPTNADWGLERLVKELRREKLMMR